MAIFRMFRKVTLRSPRSILPMCDLSISATSASASCDRSKDIRRARITAPKRTRDLSRSSFPDTLGMGEIVVLQCFQGHGIYDPFVAVVNPAVMPDAREAEVINPA